METTELRIGNWVEEEYNYFRQWTAEDFGRYIIEGKEEISDKIQPIPLTPEVLEKCGFEKDEYHECYVISQDDEHELSFHYDSNVVLLTAGDNCTSAMQLDHIKHLHQLQNIIHALTGTELEYKP